MGHSKYSLSGSSRLLKCSESFRLSEHLPREESVYAAEGTAAHEVCEKAVLTGTVVSDNEEMAATAQVYLDEINAWREQYIILEEHTERRLESNEIPDAGGTSDHVILAIDPEGKVVLHIFDYKHGVGVAVDATDNKQLLSYGVLNAEFIDVPIDYFRGTIVQPRAPGKEPVQHWEWSTKTAVRHKRQLIEAIASSDLVLGDHCNWCPAMAMCPAHRDRALELAKRNLEVLHGLDHDELLLLWQQRKAITKYLDKVEGFILQEMRNGREFDELKAVKKVSPRKWAVTEEEVLAVLKKKGVAKKRSCVQKLRTPTQLIAAGLGKKLEGLFQREDLGVKVVPATASGETVDLLQLEFGEFQEMI